MCKHHTNGSKRRKVGNFTSQGARRRSLQVSYPKMYEPQGLANLERAQGRRKSCAGSREGGRARVEVKWRREERGLEPEGEVLSLAAPSRQSLNAGRRSYVCGFGAPLVQELMSAIYKQLLATRRFPTSSTKVLGCQPSARALLGHFRAGRSFYAPTHPQGG